LGKARRRKEKRVQQTAGVQLDEAQAREDREVVGEGVGAADVASVGGPAVRGGQKFPECLSVAGPQAFPPAENRSQPVNPAFRLAFDVEEQRLLDELPKRESTASGLFA